MSAAVEAVITARRNLRAAACRVELAELGLTDIDSDVTALTAAETALDAAAGVLSEAASELRAEQAGTAGRLM